jgi:hypothetical protein
MKSKRNTEFEAFYARTAKAAAIAAAGFVGSDPKMLDHAYRSAIRFVFGVISVVMLNSKGLPEAEEVCQILREVAEDRTSWKLGQHALAELGKSSHIDIISHQSEFDLSVKDAQSVLRTIMNPAEGSLGLFSHDPIPSSWIGPLYERLIDFKPRFDTEQSGVILHRDSVRRKRSGSFFTPPYIINYIISETIARLSDPQSARILDPSMGPGEFLLRSLRFLSQNGCDPVKIAENCIFGCDIDPIAVDITRFLVWFESGAKADAGVIAEHIVCADALAGDHQFRWDKAFPEVFPLSSNKVGFDAVIGNPPYVAAKNGAMEDYKKAAHNVRGQSDYYLLFLESMLENRLIRPGGSLGMVLPDPFLVRGNAAHIRKELLRKWKVDNIVHVWGAFPSAQVANVVLVCSNQTEGDDSFPVLRLDKAGLRRRFEINPKQTFLRLANHVNPSFVLTQPKSEVLYLLDDRWQRIFSRIHGPEKSLSYIAPPFSALKDAGIDVFFRGEEIGKRAIMASEGELPILLGGQSIHRYEVSWEGQRISREAVSKPMGWYQGEKLVLQKSSAKLIAAFDREGFIIPQSIYGIKLRKDSPYHPLYLLAVLNSSFMNDYVFRAFTGYKLVQPQIELEDIKRLPIREIPFVLDRTERAELADKGRQAFDDELMYGSGDFPRLNALIDEWISSDKIEVVHDLLVYLAEIAIRIRQDQTPLVATRLDSIIDVVVERLYGQDY